MVSKARDDFPDPLRPVMTTSLSRGISTSMFLRLCSRAPLMTIFFMCGGAAGSAGAPPPQDGSHDEAGFPAHSPYHGARKRRMRIWGPTQCRVAWVVPAYPGDFAP